MATVTYTDRSPDGSSPVVTWHGVEFKDGKSVDLDKAGLNEQQKAALVSKAKGNPFFKVGEAKAKPAAKSEDEADTDQADEALKLKTVQEKGEQAKRDGKPRNVPPAYRGKREEDAWLVGWDSET